MSVILRPLHLLVLWASLCALSAGDVQSGNFGAEAPGAKTKSSSHVRRSYPFSGEIESHDKKMITLKGKKKNRVILLTAETRFVKNGAPAKPEDLTKGAQVGGSVRKNAEGKEEALQVNLKGK